MITKTLAASSANNLATSQTPGSGTPLTLTALAGTGLDTQRRVLLTFGSEASNRTMVITGKNSQGTVISETLSIASGAGSTVATVQDFLTVSQALPLGGGWTAAVTLGTNTTGSTMWQVVHARNLPTRIARLDRQADNAALPCTVSLQPPRLRMNHGSS